MFRDEVGTLFFVPYGQILKKNNISPLVSDFAEFDIIDDKTGNLGMMLLNFNYTTTADLYMPEDPHFILNHIHGELAKPESVIFGYGDESDDEYKRLQKINDNESWSIHSGVGTKNYSFIWAMCGENQEFDDMDHIETKELR